MFFGTDEQAARKNNEINKKELDMKKEEEYTWEQREKDDKYIMERMHPAVLIPGVFIGVMVIVGCIFKGIRAW